MALTVIGLQSCDSFLDTPAPNVSDENFFVDDQMALTALVGVYDPIGWGEYNQYLQWAVGDVTSDDAVKGGQDDSDQPQMYDIEHFRASDQTPIFSTVWKNFYIGINRANRLIDGVKDNPNITEPTQKRLIAEAKFLRAFNNFNLIKIFGPFPIVDHVLAVSEYKNPRNTIEECWKAIENDLKDAMGDLPKRSEMNTEELGRATWGAAASLLTKAYIFQEKWEDAYNMATSVVDSKEYDLLPNYGDLFKIESDNSVEGIFEIQHHTFPGDGYKENEGEASYSFIYQWSRDSRNGGWGFNQPTKDLFDAFETGDPRRDLTIISDGDVLWEGTVDEETVYTKYDPEFNQSPSTGYCKRKGALPKSVRNINREDQTGLNTREIRFADVLLWQAEAAVHTGKDWKTPLNRVRLRVGLGDSPFAAEPLKAIYHERRVELAMESHRYWDLVRTGRGNLIQGYTDNKRYFPIPQSEISLNPNLTPNPY